MPESVEINGFVAAAEAVVTFDHLAEYNTMVEKSSGAFVTCRGSALSILRRTDIPDECTNFVQPFVFRTNYGSKHSDGLNKAKELGFKVVPFETYTFEFKTYEEYEKEITTLIWKYRNMMDSIGVPTDGLVLQINDNAYFTGTITNTAFDGGNLAVKALAWEPGIYTSRVREIIMECEGNLQYNCKALVEPTYTEEGKCMQFVNLYNPNIMICNDIHEGDLIKFEYVNETTINFREKVIECQS
jgi:NAD-dependent DNA ligase